MPIQIHEEDDGTILTLNLSGKLEKADYERLTPAFEGLARQHGKLRVQVNLMDFHGWDMGALWDEIKFDVKHFVDIERIAVVGEKKWQHGLATFCQPFTKATIRYFDHADAAAARKWLQEAQPKT